MAGRWKGQGASEGGGKGEKQEISKTGQREMNATVRMKRLDVNMLEAESRLLLNTVDNINSEIDSKEKQNKNHQSLGTW